MAKNPEKVMQFVEKELKANPDIDTAELFEKAKAVDAGVRELSLRQFNASFPLQIKRRQTLARGGGRTGSRSRSASHRRREAMRNVLLQFARDLSAAEGRKELVELLGRVDDYVDSALEAARK